MKTLERQRAAYLAEGHVTAETRKNRLTHCIDLLVDNVEKIADAVEADYGCRSKRISRYGEVLFTLEFLKYARKYLHRWMRPQRRKTNFPFNLVGARTTVHYQPLGVIGVIGPWNFPVHLTFAPMASILAAGNRVMVKPSERTPATAELLARLIGERFDETEIAAVTGGPEIGAQFSALPFDHLMFTGGTEIGRKVMRAAAHHLVPVTLELGGKCPVVIGRTANLETVAKSITEAKGMNAGQICISSDYALVPREMMRAFVEHLSRAVQAAYPTLLNNPDYGSIIDQHHFQRLSGYLKDAREQGAEIIEINPARESFGKQPYHKLPICAILNVSDNMRVMQEEVFGPFLSVLPYDQLDEAIDYVNSHPRPLALYYFGTDRREQNCVLERTTSGGVAINDTIWHYGQNDAPFGGVGSSGMGAYHGFDGFRQFSHAKTVYRQSKFDLAGLMGLHPPYGSKFDKTMKSMIKK